MNIKGLKEDIRKYPDSYHYDRIKCL
ncbi:MAG TPA: hypothetical protein LFW20_01825 [Rickettsia endosymbiont of Omalisus fontisbellaquei]|nr:hypothetical protein [Rickettsia endosymbiont of Omalisus fontisbellaquei]